MCGRHMRKVEEEASLSLDAQVHLITERQTDMEAKQEQRLESLASALTSLKEGMVREGLIAASPRSHRSVAPSLQGSPANHLLAAVCAHHHTARRRADRPVEEEEEAATILAASRSRLRPPTEAESRAARQQQRLEQARLAQLQQIERRRRPWRRSVSAFFGARESQGRRKAAAAAAVRTAQLHPDSASYYCGKAGYAAVLQPKCLSEARTQASPFGTGPARRWRSSSDGLRRVATAAGGWRWWSE